MKNKEKIFAVAPMMDWTDRHCRMFHRILTRKAILYTEMVTAPAVVHGDRERLLGFSPQEHPVAVQLGGSDPVELAEAAQIAEQFGYDEINLNVGCPSDRVKSGYFGACLMAEPELVGRCIKAMQRAVGVPVTVKCRIGIDDQDEDADFAHFIDIVADHGCSRFIVHARKAWLSGLSPKENREVPPLNYRRVHHLKAARPDLSVIINGGIETLEDINRHLPFTDGVMLGRAAYQTPWLLSKVDAAVFGAPNPVASRRDVIDQMAPYIERQLAQGEPLHRITRHMLGLFHGCRGGRFWRRHLSENANGPHAGMETVYQALADIEPAEQAA